MALPAFAAVRRAAAAPAVQQSIDISYPPGPHLQTCSSGFAAVGPCSDRRTDTVPFRRPFSAYYAGSASNSVGLMEAEVEVGPFLQPIGLVDCKSLKKSILRLFSSRFLKQFMD